LGRRIPSTKFYVTLLGTIAYGSKLSLPGRTLKDMDVWLTSDEELVGWDERIQPEDKREYSQLYHAPVRVEHDADGMLDISGRVLAVHLYNADLEEWQEEMRKTQALMIGMLPFPFNLVSYMIDPPDLDDPEVAADMFVDVMFMVVDVIGMIGKAAKVYK